MRGIVKLISALCFSAVVGLSVNPAGACSSTWTLFFGYGSSELSETAMGSIKSLRSFADRAPARCYAFWIVGHSDGREQIDGHADIDHVRATRVVDALRQGAFASNAFTIQALGARLPLVDAGAAAEPQNRRVEVTWHWARGARVEEIAPSGGPCGMPRQRVTLPDGTICRGGDR